MPHAQRRFRAGAACPGGALQAGRAGRWWRSRPLRLSALSALASALIAAGTGLPAAELPASTAVTVGVFPLPPQYVLHGNDRPTGFAIDVLDAVARRANLRVTYRSFGSFPEAARAVESGAVDLLPSLGNIASRGGDFEFSEPVEVIPIVLFVRAATAGIDTLDDLGERTVAVVAANVGVDIVRARPGVAATVYPDAPSALGALIAGHADALIYPEPMLWKWAHDLGMEQLIKVTGEPLREVKRAMVTRHGNRALLERLNPAIVQVTASAEFRAIRARWHGEAPPFWTVTRVAWLGGALLLAVVAALGGAYHVRLLRLNRRLLDSMAERRQANEELRAERGFSAAVFESTPALVIVHDSRGRVVRINKAVEDVSGFRREELLFRKSSDVLMGVPEEQQDVRERYAALAHLSCEEALERFGATSERTWRTKDGRLCRILWNLAYLPDEQGRVAYQVASGLDITESRAAAEAIQASERLLNEAQRIAQVGSWELDLIDNTVMWSAEIFRIFEMDPSRFRATYEAFLDAIHPEDRDAVNAAYARSLETREPYQIIHRLRMPDGRIKNVHEVCESHFDDQGNPVRSFGTVQDITERKQAELELLRSQARLKQALDIAQLGTFEWYPNERTLHLSPETCELLGIAVEAAASEAADDSPLTDRVHPQDLPRLRQAVQAAAEQAGQYRIEFRVVLPGGQVRTVESLGQGIPDDRGRGGSILGLMRDVTEHRQLEQQLRQAQKMEAVGSLAGGIAHDLNNMLQVIRGHIELELFRGKQRDAPAESLDKALKATASASRLIQQLLAFARSQVLQMRAVDLNDLMAQQVLMLKRVIRRDVDISVRPAEGRAVVQADKGMLEQVIVNLCVNARDAMSEGGEISIELSHLHADKGFCQVHAWARPTTYVVVTVRDTGSGMSPEVRQRIFEPFFTTKAPGKGTGLGLAMVYGIMQQHDGMVTAQSEPASGATFTLYLPSSEAQPLPQQDVAGAEIVGGSETILVAEDEPAVRDLVVAVLREQGYQVHAASDGEAALRIFEAHRDTIDLALLDVVMPKLGGPGVYERLIAERPGLPVVFSTGYAWESGDRDVVGRSGVRVVHKPFAPAELLQAIRRALDEKR